MTDTCGQDCDREATTVVVTVNGWVLDCCDEYAKRLVDHLALLP